MTDRELTDAELHHVVGGLEGTFRFSKIQRAAAVRSARRHFAPGVPTVGLFASDRVPARQAPVSGGCTGTACAS